MIFGVGRELITPFFKTNISCTGAFGVPFEGIHDDVYVKAFVMDDNRTRALVVSTDLLFHDESLNLKIFEYAKAKYGIPMEHVVINHTHNHNAPSALGYDNENVSEEYEAFLEERTLRAIDRAFVNTFEGDMYHGTIEEYFLSVNRRRRMEDGTIQNRPNPMGPKDSTMDVLKVCDKGGRIRVLMVVYSCHPAIYPDLREISSEYPGRLCHRLEGRFYGSTALFLQGSGGNVKTNISSRGDRFIRGTYEDIDKMAMVLEDNVARVIGEDSMDMVSLYLGGTSFSIPVDVEPAPVEYFERALGLRPDKPLLRNNARKILDNYDTMENKIVLKGGILRLSEDLCIAHMGGEPCFEAKELVRKAMGDDVKVIFTGYSDAIAYIPTDSLIGEGGYEVDSFLEYGFKGPFKVGIDGKISHYYREGRKILFG